MARRKVKNGEKSPWEQCLTRPVDDSLSVVNGRFVGAVAQCQTVLLQREIFEIMGTKGEK